MPRHALTRSIKGTPAPASAPAPAPAPAPAKITLGETLVHSFASGVGSGIGFNLANFLLRPQPPVQKTESCLDFEHDMRKCMVERDDEFCSKVWSNYEKNVYTSCVNSANK